jgi:hypothetical protein
MRGDDNQQGAGEHWNTGSASKAQHDFDGYVRSAVDDKA